MNPRPYHRTGLHTTKKSAPALVERIADDDAVPDDELSPFERSVREWRREMLDDLGGLKAASAAQRALVNAAVGSQILLITVDAYLFDLAARNGVVNKRSRRVFQVVSDRMRIAEGLVRQLLALGLERRAVKGRDLSEYVAQRYGATGRPTDHGSEAAEKGAVDQSLPQHGSTMVPASPTKTEGK